MKINLSKRSMCVFLMTLLVFLDLEPYFVWSHVAPIGYRIYTVVAAVTILYMFLVVMHKRLRVSGMPSVQCVRSIPIELFFASMGCIVLLFYQFFLSGWVTETKQPFNLTRILFSVGFMMFILQDHITLKRVFCYAKTIFAISLVPSLVFFALELIGVSLPAVRLATEEGRAASGQFYEVILGIAVRIRSNDGLNRICGIYSEPGFVGTVSALFLAGDNFNLKRKENRIIAISGLCTFSLAFVVMMVIGYLLHYLGKMKNRKKSMQGMTGVVCLLLVFFLFMSIPFPKGSALSELQARLVFSETFFNEERFGGSTSAMRAYDQFIRSDAATILLGYGKDTRVVAGTKTSIWQKVCSYKEYIFYYGMIGFALLISWLVTSVYTKYRDAKGKTWWAILTLLVVFLCSVYQRPEVAYFYYLCLLFGGASNLLLLEETV